MTWAREPDHVCSPLRGTGTDGLSSPGATNSVVVIYGWSLISRILIRYQRFVISAKLCKKLEIFCQNYIRFYCIEVSMDRF